MNHYCVQKYHNDFLTSKTTIICQPVTIRSNCQCLTLGKQKSMFEVKELEV